MANIPICVIDAATLIDHIHEIKECVYAEQIRLVVPLCSKSILPRHCLASVAKPYIASERVEKALQKVVEQQTEQRPTSQPKQSSRSARKEYPAFDINPQVTKEFLNRPEAQSFLTIQKADEEYAPWQEEETLAKSNDGGPSTFAQALLAKVNMPRGLAEMEADSKGMYEPPLVVKRYLTFCKAPPKPKLVARAGASNTAPWKPVKKGPNVSLREIPEALRPLLSCALFQLHEKSTSLHEWNAMTVLSDDPEIRATAQKLNFTANNTQELRIRASAQSKQSSDRNSWGDLEKEFGVREPTMRPAKSVKVAKPEKIEQHVNGDIAKAEKVVAQSIQPTVLEQVSVMPVLVDQPAARLNAWKNFHATSARQETEEKRLFSEKQAKARAEEAQTGNSQESKGPVFTETWKQVNVDGERGERRVVGVTKGKTDREMPSERGAAKAHVNGQSSSKDLNGAREAPKTQQPRSLAAESQQPFEMVTKKPEPLPLQQPKGAHTPLANGQIHPPKSFAEAVKPRKAETTIADIVKGLTSPAFKDSKPRQADAESNISELPQAVSTPGVTEDISKSKPQVSRQNSSNLTTPRPSNPKPVPQTEKLSNGNATPSTNVNIDFEDSDEEVVVFHPRGKRFSAQKASPKPSPPKQSPVGSKVQTPAMLAVELSFPNVQSPVVSAVELPASKVQAPEASAADPATVANDQAMDSPITDFMQQLPTTNTRLSANPSPKPHALHKPQQQRKRHSPKNSGSRHPHPQSKPMVVPNLIDPDDFGRSHYVNPNVQPNTPKGAYSRTPRGTMRGFPDVPQEPEPDYVLKSGAPRASTRGRGRLWVP